jgi:hypothetical protein
MKSLRNTLAILLFTALVVPSFGQNEFYNDGASVYVQAGGLIYVQGEVINDDGAGLNYGRMYNSGNIQLTGNWTNISANTNVFQAFDPGTTTFLGTGAVQTIGGTMDTYFNNLTISKSGAATQEVRQLRNSLCDGILNLTNDFLNTQTFTFLVSNPSPAAIARTGAVAGSIYNDVMTQGYVTSTPGSAGRLARATSNLFPGAIYFYPVGNGTRFRPVEITPTSVGNNIYAVQFVNLPTFSTGLHSASLASIFPTWYHFIERAVAAGSPENIRIYWDDVTDTYCTFPAVTLSEWNLALWEDLSPTTTVGNAAPILSHTTKNGYPGTYSTPWISNSFALADLMHGPSWGAPCTILDVNSTPLVATPRTTDILLTWNTLQEHNNDGFEMQRSTDGVNFEPIGWVDGIGESTVPQAYSLVDPRVVPNQRYYYRAKQIDMNGASAMSNIAEAMITGNGAFVVGEFYPNPSQNNNTLWVIAPNDTEITVKVINPLGQEVFGKDYSLVSGYNEIPFSLDALADGNYYAIISHGSEQFTRKFSLER